MALDALMAALLVPLQAIPAIGQVYGYERLVGPQDVPSVMGGVLGLRYWCLSRVATTELWRGNATVERVHRLRLRGYMAIDDSQASERVYQDLLDQVLETLSVVIEVPGSVTYMGPPWLENQEAYLLADTLPVHWSETYLLASEWLTVTPEQGAGLAVHDYRTLAEWVVARLLTIPDLGALYPYERLVPDSAQTSAVFGPSQAIRAWTLTREHVEGERAAGLEVENSARLLLRGYLSVNDAEGSELVLQGLLEQIAAVLRPSVTVGTLDRVGPLQIAQVAHTMLGQTFRCHFVECQLPVVTFDVPTTV